MSTLSISIVNEYKKLFARRRIRLTMIVVLTVILSACILVKLAFPSFAITPLSILKLISGFVLPLFVAYITFDLFISEKADDTLKNVLMLPIRSTNLYAAKLITGVLVSLTLLLLILIETTLLSLLLNGIDVVVDGLFPSLSAYILTILPIILTAVLSGLLAQYFNSTGSALVVSILFVLALNALSIFVPILRQLNPLTYYDAFEGILFGVRKMTNLVTMLLYMLSYYIIGIVISFLGMNRYTEQKL